jgi:hypothetical protein
MAGLDLTPIEGSGRSGGRIPLEDISAVVAETVDEAYAYFTDSPQPLPRLQTPPFSSKEVAEKFAREARSYAYQRPAGRLVFSGNPARSGNKGEYVIRFRVDAYEGTSESE